MGHYPAGNCNTLAELSVPAPCYPPASLDLLPGALWAAPPCSLPLK